jgi:exodeoxyribonuclease VII large subunit
LAVPVRAELLAQLSDLGRRGHSCLSRHSGRLRERYDLTICRWPEAQSLFAPAAQRLAAAGARWPRSLAARAAHARADLNAIAPRLRSQLFSDRAGRAKEKLEALWTMAQLVHPDRPLTRGFARVTRRDGTTLTSAADASIARALTVHFADGRIDARMDDESGGSRLERPRRRSYVASSQPNLFESPEE